MGENVAQALLGNSMHSGWNGLSPTQFRRHHDLPLRLRFHYILRSCVGLDKNFFGRTKIEERISNRARWSRFIYRRPAKVGRMWTIRLRNQRSKHEHAGQSHQSDT